MSGVSSVLGMTCSSSSPRASEEYCPGAAAPHGTFFGGRKAAKAVPDAGRKDEGTLSPGAPHGRGGGLSVVSSRYCRARPFGRSTGWYCCSLPWGREPGQGRKVSSRVDF